MAKLMTSSGCHWQPIDTAPRDGMPVLLFLPAWDMFEVGVYNAALGQWQERTGDLMDTPSHWMPLPPPPGPEAQRPPDA